VGSRLWFIELKTERASHRATQIPGYFALGHQHYPDSAIDLTYLTPPMQYVFSAPGPWGRFAHVTWDELAPVFASIWATPVDPGEQDVVRGLLYTIATLFLTPAEWRATFAVPPRPVDAWEVPVAEGMRLAALTAPDGEQRAVDYDVEDLEDLQALRLELRNQLASSAAESDLRLRHGVDLATGEHGDGDDGAGSRNAFEVRLSRYAEALYSYPVRERATSPLPSASKGA
jgi:hypothetical protein